MNENKQNNDYSELSQVNSNVVYNQLPEYIRIARYSQYNINKKRRETWSEQTDRVFKMHKVKFQKHLDNPEFMEMFNFAKNMVEKKYVLGSQRALQFGGPAILNKETRIYNCSTTYVDRTRVFQEIMFALLCGVGVGFSVQKHHVKKLPKIQSITTDDSIIYKIPDSIEGWSDSIGVLCSCYFTENQEFPIYFGKNIIFDFSLIRPAGAYITNIGGKAPGPDGLAASLKKIKEVFDNCIANRFEQLRPIDAYDIIVHSSDAVLSGGIRRSATIALFSLDDDEMIKAKTGDWYIKNPQRARSNNSVLLLRNNTPEKQYMDLIQSVKQFGEPGIIWADDTEALYNPCVEIGLYAYDSKGNSGFSFCNLSEINMASLSTPEEFYDRCKAASILGTFQAAYTNFGYLGKVTQDIVEREALLGVSMTGMMDTPDISFDSYILERGANIVKEVNEKVSNIIGINKAARTTCVKPAGSTSCILGTSSGIHPCHSKRYFRRVQSNSLEEPLKYFKKYNQQAVDISAWSAGKTDEVITFLCKSKPNALTKDKLSAIDFLEKVKLVQKHWVTTGRNIDRCVQPWLNHNVSNTITIKDHEWESAAKFIYDNREFFAGISMLGDSGDMTYHQAPFQAVYSHDEIAKLYGAGSVFASGLIVHANDAFDNNLYTACSTLMGYGEKLEMPDLNNSKLCLVQSDKMYKKVRWIAQAKKFTNRHFGGDLLKMTYCLKAVDAWKTWCDLKRTYKFVDWEQFIEENDNTKPTEYQACSGGSCEIIRF
jgi:ribonucleoside-triphosphate reductase